MTETNGFIEYGKKLEALGQMFQNPKCTLSDLITACTALGLIMSFRVEPDPKESIDLTVDMDAKPQD